MRLKLILIILAVLFICGCTERAMQQNILTGGDPALATRQDIESLKTLINERFDRLEKNKR